MRHPYYFVPICPYCASQRTGRYVRKPYLGSDGMLYRSLKNGELIRFKDREPVKNCYCTECGQDFIGAVRLRYLTDTELEEEKEKRDTDRDLERYEELHPEVNKPAKGGLFSGLLRF